ncbi:MAG: pyruvate dehydrogenase (acetyl-transferring), homodimeric type [Bacteroidia bacterium]
MTDKREIENQEWIQSLKWVTEHEGRERAQELLTLLQNIADKAPASQALITTPYVNTIPPSEEVAYPGNLKIEQKLLGLVRWNAMAMVVRANRQAEGIGGHISTYASFATCFETGFHHFFKGGTEADMVYFQGHAAPGIYARSFMEGRLSEKDMDNFRRELKPEGGLPSYPHPMLMPEYWRFPTVSMGLGAIEAIYQARFNRYLHHRKIKDTSGCNVWVFLGDGEMDEPESTGALTLAAREKLDNLIFVINCNLQRLDGPVRGNGKVIQELESLFRGAGWQVIKVLWSSAWDKLFAKDTDGALREALADLVDGQLQHFAFAGGKYMREHFFSKNEKLKALVADTSDEELDALHWGGHDPEKVFNAFKRAVEHTGQPVVVLAQTVKGFGQGASAGEASNISHKTTMMDDSQLRDFRDFFHIDVADENLTEIPLIRPDKNSEEGRYLLSQRKSLGGFLPERNPRGPEFRPPATELFEEFYKGSGDSEIPTTKVIVQLLQKLLSDEATKDAIVPIVPDESRTFGMDSLFRTAGIYASQGQQYDPVDKDNLLFYNESKEGVLIEEGITEAGAMSTFIAAATAYSNHGINMIPFFVFYSMFGFQRIGDLIWAAADARSRGFLVGGISGRTTLAGEGLQHLDGQSHVYALSVPGLMAYDPAFAYELTVIVQDGIRRMYSEQEDIMYYLTVMNEAYRQPQMPEGSRDGILRGMYRFRKSSRSNGRKVHLLGSGAILPETITAAEKLEEHYDVAADIWSVTSWKALYDDARAQEDSTLFSGKKGAGKSYIHECFDGEEGVIVAATDYLKALPQSVAHHFPLRFIALGTDGFGRSDTISALRNFFRVDAKHIMVAALSGLAAEGKMEKKEVEKIAGELGVRE